MNVDTYYNISKLGLNSVIGGIYETIESENLVIDKIIISASDDCHILNCVLHKTVQTVEDIKNVVVNSLCDPTIRRDGYIWYPKCDIFVYFKKGE